MKTYNSAPYYDDFDQSKNFVKILFKPGYAVQARELTQLQTAIQNQITKMGNHLFKDGTIIDGLIPSIIQESYFVANSPNFTLSKNDIVIGQTTGSKVRIINSETISNTEIAIWFQNANSILIDKTEILNVYTEANVLKGTITLNQTTPVLKGTRFNIQQGVIYLSGVFLYLETSNYYLRDPLPTRRFGLSFEEIIVSSLEDESLLDPAKGSYNYAAPGGDRVQFSLSLDSKEYQEFSEVIDEISSENFITFITVVDGEIRKQTEKTIYNKLGDELAKRTYDESGDYTVEPFKLDIFSFPASAAELQANPDLTEDDKEYFGLNISPGSAYVKGYNFDSKFPTIKKIRKARNYETKSGSIARYDYGNYIFVDTISGLPDLNIHRQIELKNSLNETIGTAFLNDIVYDSTISSDVVYRMYLYNIKFSGTETIASVTNITNSADIPMSAEISDARYGSGVSPYIIKSYSQVPFVKLPTPYVKTLLDGIGNSDTVFYAKKQFNVVLSGDPISSGVISSVTPNQQFVGLGSQAQTVVESEYFAVVESNAGTGPAAGTILTYSDGLRITVDTTTQLTVSYDNATNFGTGGNNNIRLYAKIACSNWEHKTKTLTTAPEFTYNTPENNTITLPHVDGYKINSIIGLDSEEIIEYNLLSYYTIDYGQKDDIYDFIKLNKTSELPVEVVKLKINYQYFARSGSGFFNVDSYANSGLAYSQIPTYTSSTGEYFKLSDILDFRPDLDTVEGNSITNITGNGSTITVTSSNHGLSPLDSATISNTNNWNGIYIVDSVIDVNTFTISSNSNYTAETSGTVYLTQESTTLVSDNFPVINEDLNYDYSYYLSRRDKLVVNKNEIKLIEGVSSLTPEYPRTPSDSMLLYNIELTPFTSYITDIQFNYIENRRYTMKDIATIDKRIDRMEYYTSLNLLEKQVQDTKIPSSTPGLDKFKSGIIVDPFDSYYVGDLLNSDFKCSIDVDNRVLRSAYSSFLDSFEIDSISNLKIKNNIAFLNYEETPCFTQNLASRVRNANIDYQMNWEGNLTLFPPNDVWVDDTQKNIIVVNKSHTANIHGTQGYRNKILNNRVLYNRWKNSVDWSAQQSAEEERLEKKLNEESVLNSRKYTLSGEKIKEENRRTSTSAYDASTYTEEWVRQQTIRFVSTGHLPNTSLVLNVNGELLDYKPHIELILQDNITDLTCDEVFISNYITAKISNMHNNRIFIYSPSNTITNTTNVPIELKKDGVTIQTSTVSSSILEQGIVTNRYGVISGEVFIPQNTIKSGAVSFDLIDNLGKSSSSTVFNANVVIKPTTEFDVKYTIKIPNYKGKSTVNAVKNKNTSYSDSLIYLPEYRNGTGTVGQIGRINGLPEDWSNVNSLRWDPDYYASPYPYFENTANGWVAKTVWRVVLKPRPTGTTQQNGWTDYYQFNILFPDIDAKHTWSVSSVDGGEPINGVYWNHSPDFNFDKDRVLSVNYNESIAGSTEFYHSQKMFLKFGEPSVLLTLTVSQDQNNMSLEELVANPSKWIPYTSTKRPTITHKLYLPSTPVDINPITGVTDIQVQVENSDTILPSLVEAAPEDDTATTIGVSPEKVLKVDRLTTWTINPNQYDFTDFTSAAEWFRSDATNSSKTLNIKFNDLKRIKPAPNQAFKNYRLYYIQYRYNINTNYSVNFKVNTTAVLNNAEIIDLNDNTQILANTWEANKYAWLDKPSFVNYDGQTENTVTGESEVILIRVLDTIDEASVYFQTTITDINDGAISVSHTSSLFNLIDDRYELHTYK